MATADKIPAVLRQPNGNSLSLERLINQTLDIMRGCEVRPEKEDQLSILMDDWKTVRDNLDRS